MKRLLFVSLALVVLGLPFNLIIVQSGVALCALVLLAGRVRGDWTFERTPVDAPVLLYAAAAPVSLVMTAEPLHSWFSSTSFWVFLAYYPLSQAMVITGGVSRLRPVLYAMLSLSFLTAVYGIIQHFTGLDVVGLGKHLGWAPGSHGERFTAVAFFTRHTTLAFTQALAIITGASLFATERRSSVRVALAALMAPMVVVIFFTYVRMAWIGIAAGLFVVGLAVNAKRAAAALAVVAAAGALAVAASPTVLSKLRVTFTAEGSTNRNFMWTRALEMAADHPVAGIGYGNYTPLANTYYDRYDRSFIVRCHAHNMYLHLWCETGAAGLMAFLFLWLVFFRSAREAWRRVRGADGPPKAMLLASGGAATCVLLGSAAQDLFFDGQIAFFLVFLMAAGMAVAMATAAPASVVTSPST